MRYSNKIIILLITLIAAVFMLSLTPTPVKAFSGSGSGTAEDPYVITTVDQLQEMKDNLTACYILGNDIDASATSGWNGGAGFVPIGDATESFTGSFDGKGYKISNLYINRPSTNFIGLFGIIQTRGIVENVGLEDENVTGCQYVGSLAGVNSGTILNSYTTGAVSGHYDVGGLVGLNNSGTVSNCYSTSTASGGNCAGGLVGCNNYGTLSNSYSTGSVSGSGNVGGLVGENTGTVSNSFWDKQTSGKSTSAGGTGKTTEEMKNVRTYTDLDWSEGLEAPVWDFVGNPYDDTANEDIWNIHLVVNNGYPVLEALTVNQLPTVSTDWTDLGMNLTDHTPAISWTKGTDADGDTVTTYVYVGTTSTPTTVETSATEASCDLGNTVPLSDGVTYYYRLRSWDGYEWSDYTTADQFRMNSKPSNPTSWTNLGMNLTDHTPTVIWSGQSDAESDAVTVYVYVGTTSTPTTEEGNSVEGTLDLGSIVTLNDGVTYYYRLRAYDGYEWNDSYTTSDEFRMNTPPTTPTNPTNLSLRETDHTPDVSWTASTDAESDTITYYVETSDDGITYHLDWSGTGTSCTLDYYVFLDGEDYWWRVLSSDSYENSNYTTPDKFQFNQLPTASGLKTEGQTNPTTLETLIPTFSWVFEDADEDSQSNFQIQVGTSENDNSKWDYTSPTTTDNSIVYAGASLSRGVTYYVRMRVFDGYEWSDWTNGTFLSPVTGGGLPSVAFQPPTPPPEGFSILINKGAEFTSEREVTLKLNGGPDTKKMAISERPDFLVAVQETYVSTKTWILSEGDGLKTVYAKFYTEQGQSSPVVSDSIILKTVVEKPIEEMTKEEISIKIIEILKKLIQLYTELIQILKG